MTNIIDLTRSSPSDVTASSGKPWPTALEEAIRSARRRRLRKTLTRLCRQLPDAAKMTASLLLISDDMANLKPKRKHKAEVRDQKMEKYNISKDRVESLDENHDEDETQADDEEDEEDNEDEDVDNGKESESDGDDVDDDEEDDDEEDDDEEDDDEEDDDDEEEEETPKYAKAENIHNVSGRKNSDSADALLNGNKRLRSRFAVCSNCEKEFDVTQNGKRACRWHDGILEADMEGDFWADHDERCHGIIDSYELQQEYPEGYIYECCGQQNKTPGCSIGRHVETIASSSKRRRL